MRLSTFAAVAVAVALPAGAALAHHGWSSYAMDKPMHPTARVVESRWASPHGSIVIMQGDQRWDVVLAPIARMQSRGLAREDIAVGRTVTVHAYPRKDGTREMRAERIVAGDKTVELR